MMKNTIEDKSIMAETEDILPIDTITCIEWNEIDIMKFGISSFDGTFRLYEIISNNQKTSFHLFNLFKYNFPLTSFAFMGKSNYVAIGTCDGKILLVKLNFDQFQEILEYEELGSHTFHIQKMFFVTQLGLLITVGTGKTIKIWDLEKLELSDSIDFQSNIMDCHFAFPILIIALPFQKIKIININQVNRFISNFINY